LPVAVPTAPLPIEQARSAALASVGVSLPETVVASEIISARLGVRPDWIERRTGINSRHVAGPADRLTDHATVAGQRALARAHIAAEDLDLVLVATITADEVCPNAGPVIAHQLGAHRAGAFDVGAACTGFLSALSIGAGQIETGRAQAVLVIGADFMLRITDPDDRGTAAVFADGAGAVVLVPSETVGGGIGPVVLGADGGRADYIFADRTSRTLRMDGHETFRAAVDSLSSATLEAVAKADLILDEIDLFVYHQANSRILQAVAERLELPAERVVDCIGGYGNTGAATLPLALDFSERAGRLWPGHRVLLGAFGAGLTWGAAVAEWGVS
jgi:3-oxoacyl-[acyl-carrier-protein] synthase-3